ncbi:MAG: energy transducer TonB [Candidatus Binataceae bacterium]
MTELNHNSSVVLDEGPPPRRHLVALGASILAHVALIAMIIYLAPRPPDGGHDWVLAYLVEMGNGSGNTPGGGKGPLDVRMSLTPMPEAPMRSESPERTAANVSIDDPAEAARRADAMASLNAAALRPHIRRAANGAESSLDGGGAHSGSGGSGLPGGTGEGSGAGSGIGAGGGGLQVAHADYGANPAPPYPARSRRRAEEGTVTLHVLVAIDGSVERAEIAESSGFDDLDRSALETVRRRWRFMPAHRGRQSVESWVLVPIKFALQ